MFALYFCFHCNYQWSYHSFWRNDILWLIRALCSSNQFCVWNPGSQLNHLHVNMRREMRRSRALRKTRSADLVMRICYHNDRLSVWLIIDLLYSHLIVKEIIFTKVPIPHLDTPHLQITPISSGPNFPPVHHVCCTGCFKVMETPPCNSTAFSASMKIEHLEWCYHTL